MILIEIENTNTGAVLRIPERYTYIRETFENSVEDFSWEEWTESVSTTAANIREYNEKGHCLYGTWEVLCQSGPWDRAIMAVQQDASQDEIAIRLLKNDR